jgi:hypothetical protein
LDWVCSVVLVAASAEASDAYLSWHLNRTKIEMT